jgi:acetoin utilization protein AcuC
MTDHRSSIVYHPQFLDYDFGAHHPLRPERIVAGLDLLESARLWSRDTETLVAPQPNLVDLELVHLGSYIQTVQAAGNGAASLEALAAHGLASGDNPAFHNMHESAALVASGCAEAARRILAGDLDHVFHPAGGLHHALKDRASGFCVYNDPAVAAAVAMQEADARVLYVDFDCHHGDGVQWLFYDEPRVLTLSFHESGRFLFPGTGFVDEIGEGAGRRYSANIPVQPYTRDASWLESIRSVLPALAERFHPDLIISSHGADTHDWDPLTHLSLTTDAFFNQARLVHELAHKYAAGRWIAVGSGGYDWRRVVPRAWAIVWAEMTERELDERLPEEWRARWETAEIPLPESYRDGDNTVPHTERLAEIEHANSQTVARLRSLLDF